MPRHANVAVAANQWVQLTDNNVTAIRVGNYSTQVVLLQATNGVTPPTSVEGAVNLAPGQTVAEDLTLSLYFGGVTGANRVWAWSPVAITLSVSHA